MWILELAQRRVCVPSHNEWSALSPYFGIGALKTVAFILIGHLKQQDYSQNVSSQKC